MGPEAAALVDAGAAAVTGGKRLRARFCFGGLACRLRRPAQRSGARRRGRSRPAPPSRSSTPRRSCTTTSSTTPTPAAAARPRTALSRRCTATPDGPGTPHPSVAPPPSCSATCSSPGATTSSSRAWRAWMPRPPRRPAGEYALMRRDVTIGQFLDIAEESAFVTEPDDRHAERALRVASLKSARYSVQQPLLIGAALAGADAAQLEALRAFGHPVGLAFQLRDDVLGVFGDESVTGKPSGDDLREGKRTVLVALTREGLADIRPPRRRRAHRRPDARRRADRLAAAHDHRHGRARSRGGAHLRLCAGSRSRALGRSARQRRGRASSATSRARRRLARRSARPGARRQASDCGDAAHFALAAGEERLDGRQADGVVRARAASR